MKAKKGNYTHDILSTHISCYILYSEKAATSTVTARTYCKVENTGYQHFALCKSMQHAHHVQFLISEVKVLVWVFLMWFLHEVCYSSSVYFPAVDVGSHVWFGEADRSTNRSISAEMCVVFRIFSLLYFGVRSGNRSF